MKHYAELKSIVVSKDSEAVRRYGRPALDKLAAEMERSDGVAFGRSRRSVAPSWAGRIGSRREDYEGNVLGQLSLWRNSLRSPP